MLPFVMRELVELVMKKKALPLGDALYYIYSSKLYKSLLDKSTKLWYSSCLLYTSSVGMLAEDYRRVEKRYKPYEMELFVQMFYRVSEYLSLIHI